jgi:hypothetical protein
LFLIVTQGGDELLHLGWGRLEGSELVRELVHRQCCLVPSLFIVGKRLFRWELSAKPGVKSLGEQFGIAEGVADALRRDRVLMVVGIAHQRPAGVVGFPEEEREVRSAQGTLATFAVAHSFGQLRREVQDPHEVAFDVGADLVKGVVGEEDNRQGLSVIGRQGDDHPLWP